MNLPKILLHGNSPQVRTGYGVQIALLAERLADAGYEVAVSSTYGNPQACGMTTWTSPRGHKIPVYPSLFLASGDDVIMAHAKQFFGADEGWIIPCIDVWCLISPDLKHFNVASWAPVDHDPVPKMVLDYFDRTNSKCIAMSRHGLAEYEKAGLDPTFIPLAVDTQAFKPTFEVTVAGQTVDARTFMQLPHDAFVVGWVGMNKDPMCRKGWPEGMQAFAEFHRRHPNSILHIHSEKSGMGGGVDLVKLAEHCGIPEDALRFTNQYAYMIGFAPELLAAMYTSFDVLLSPSLGEGFCVPLIEAQACGVPVIATDFTAQKELVGAGWTVSGQRHWDANSSSWYQIVNVGQIVDALEQAYAADLDAMQADAVKFAADYDADTVFDTRWRPFLATLDTRPPADKPPMNKVAVLVPALNRPKNVRRLVDSFNATNDGTAYLYYVLDVDDAAQIEAVEAAGATWLPAERGTSFASKVNAGYQATTEDWLLLIGDDVEFTPGWLAAARKLSDRFDVIGTNDSQPGRVRNPKVASGKHADHFFVRRSYVDDVGSSLEGPGLVLAEAYFHFFGDVELIQLARARGVFTPCLDSVVIHHHPGYDGREDLRHADPTYMKAVDYSAMDEITFRRRASLIEQHRVVKKDIWA